MNAVEFIREGCPVNQAVQFVQKTYHRRIRPPSEEPPPAQDPPNGDEPSPDQIDIGKLAINDDLRAKIAEGYVQGRSNYRNASAMAFHVTVMLLEAGVSETDILSIMSNDFGVSKAWKPQGIEFIKGKIKDAVKALKENPPKDQPKRLKTISKFIAEHVPLNYVLDLIIDAGGLYTLTAKTGAGKTAFLILLALAIAFERRDLFRNTIEPGRVAYLTCENPRNLRMRLMAALGELGNDPREMDKCRLAQIGTGGWSL